MPNLFSRSLFATLACFLLATAVLPTNNARAQATGDANALAKLHRAVVALSGTSSWSEIHAMRLEGTLSLPGKEGATQSFSWEDVWKKRQTWYLHKIGSGANERALVQSPKRGKMLRREDNVVIRADKQETLPPVQIPGAVLSVEEDDPSCSVKNRVPQKKANSDAEDTDLVQIDCAAPKGLVTGESQVWTFSRSSGLPLSVSFSRMNLQRAGAQTTEVVRFKHYMPVNGLLVPDVTESSLGGITRKATLQTVKFVDPSEFPKSDFEVSK